MDWSWASIQCGEMKMQVHFRQCGSGKRAEGMFGGQESLAECGKINLIAGFCGLPLDTRFAIPVSNEGTDRCQWI